MNTKALRASMALGLVLVFGEAAAIPSWVFIIPSFGQLPGNGEVFASLIIEAQTSNQYLAIAGGFTITCGTSPLEQPVGPRGFPVYHPLGVRFTLNVPEPPPGEYTVPNWSSIPAGQCGTNGGQCVMAWKAQARDETSEFSIGLPGVGVNFSLFPSGEITDGNSTLINICRYGQPQCCTPGCQIP